MISPPVGELGSPAILGNMIFGDAHQGEGVMIRIPYSGACLISCNRQKSQCDGVVYVVW